MTCGKCRGYKEKSIKCLIAALDTVKEHALSKSSPKPILIRPNKYIMLLVMQRESEESVITIQKLKTHNEKLHKALDLLKERQECMVQPEKRRKLSPKKKKDDISPLPQSQSSLNMNIALNSIELSDEDLEMGEDESIAETEATFASPRKLRLVRKPDIRNLENLQPSNVSNGSHSWISKTPKNAGVLTKLSLTHKGNTSILKQARLKVEGNKTSNSEKDVIEESPNFSIKRSRPPRTLMQRSATETALSADDSSSSSTSLIKIPQPTFAMDDEDFSPASSDLLVMPPPASPPALKINNTSDSVIMLTPATQDIIFLNDTSEDDVTKMGTMDVLAEIMKEDEDACSNALRMYERKMIDQQKHFQPKLPQIEKANPVQLIKNEPISQPEPDVGNESTKLPEDIEKYMMDIQDEESKVSEEEFPQPIVIKEEPKLTFKEQYNIECEECEKFINFMGSNLTDEKIKSYLSNCKHVDVRSSTPPGFWNPHMVTFAEDDPRNEVLIDTRFREQRLKK
ncbi:hypothetical protein KR009_007829 [Drosophila setifemur]|nr:hypothetical protein KR009_007829 [Drosophila setifemur]